MFTITKLAGHRALVQGTDFTGTEGKVVLDTYEWDSIDAHLAKHDTADAYEDALAEFYAPLNKALAEIENAAAPVVDDLFQVVITEGSEGTAPVQSEVISIGHHTAILRLINTQPDTDRLIWVDEGQLEIIAAEGKPASTSNDSFPDHGVALDQQTVDGLTTLISEATGVPADRIHYIGETEADDDQ